MFDPMEISGYITAAKAALDLLKAGKELVPKGKEADALARKIEEAEGALKRADARLAKDFSYPLCKCTFPPQIMLWVESTQKFVCSNESCGKSFDPEAKRKKLRESLARMSASG